MKINQDKVRKLMEEYAGGNYNRFVREFGMDPSHLYKCINTGVGER